MIHCKWSQYPDTGSTSPSPVLLTLLICGMEPGIYQHPCADALPNELLGPVWALGVYGYYKDKQLATYGK